jgi:chromosome segregation ATPase
MSDIDTQRILTAIEHLATGQSSLRGEIDGIRGEIGGIRGEIDGIRVRMDGLQGEVNRMRSDIMERIDRVQYTLDQTRDEIVVNFANTDRAERMARAAVDDARITTDVLRTMQRQISRLQTDVEHLKGPP